MRNFRQLRSALVVAILIGAGMVASSPALHAAIPGSDKSKAVRCANLQRGIAAAVALGDAELQATLQALYDAYCVAQ
jgi:hypothetical protein